MRIRDHLNRRIVPAHFAMLVGFFGAMAGTFIGGPIALGLAVLLLLAGAIAAGYLQGGISCPRCRNKIGGLSSLPKAGFWRLADTIRVCPFCGVSLDSEADHAG